MEFFRVITKRISGFFKSIQSQLVAKLSKLKRLPLQLAKKIKDIIKEIFKTLIKRPDSLKDYVKAGRLYISKRSIAFLSVLLCAVVILIDWFLIPYVKDALGGDKIIINTERFHTANGSVSVYNEDRQLLYEGEMENGRISGKGKLFQDEALIFEGEFKNEQYHGLGSLYRDKELIYEGSFSNNRFEGYGRLYEHGQLRYEGEFKNDLYHGQGKLYKEDICCEGSFVEGSLEGACKLSDGNGAVFYNGIVHKGEISYPAYLTEPISGLSSVFPTATKKGEINGKALYVCERLGLSYLEGEEGETDRFLFYGTQELYGYSLTRSVVAIMDGMEQEAYSDYCYRITDAERRKAAYLGITLEKDVRLRCIKYLVGEFFVKGYAVEGEEHFLFYEIGSV